MVFNLSPFFVLAQKAGFEPALRLSHTTPLAGEPLEPLGYFCIPAPCRLFKRRYNIIAYPARIVKVNFDFLQKTFCFFARFFSDKYCESSFPVIK